MGLADARRLMGLEEENRRLKKPLTEAILDNIALNAPLGKSGLHFNWLSGYLTRELNGEAVSVWRLNPSVHQLGASSLA